MTKENQPKQIFDDETIKALVELGEVLRSIRKRLVEEEGYQIVDGRLIKGR